MGKNTTASTRVPNKKTSVEPWSFGASRLGFFIAKFILPYKLKAKSIPFKKIGIKDKTKLVLWTIRLSGLNNHHIPQIGNKIKTK